MRRAALLPVLLVSLAGCTFDDPCNFGSCLESDAGEGANSITDAGANAATDSGQMVDPDGSANSRPDASTNSVTPDAETNETDTGTSTDAGIDMATEADMAIDPASDSCVVDIFTFQCTPDQYEVNDDFARNLGTIGCGADPALRNAPYDRTIDPRLCPLEQADKFSLIVAECSIGAVELELDFDVETPCSADLFEIFADTFSCQSPGVTCTRTGDTFNFRWEAVHALDADIRNVVFGARSSEDVFIDYSVRIRSN